MVEGQQKSKNLLHRIYNRTLVTYITQYKEDFRSVFLNPFCTIKLDLGFIRQQEALSSI